MATKAKDLIVSDEQGARGFLVLAGEGGAVDIGEVIHENVGPGGLNPADLDRIKVPAGGVTTWTVPTEDGETDAKEIEGVIVAYRDVRAYWRDPYNGDKNPPDCFSPDTEVGIGDPGGACSRCPHAQFGSKLDAKGNPGKGQACAQRKLLLILQPTSLLPAVVSVPPSSLAPMRKYLLRLAGVGKPYHTVVTGLELMKAQSSGNIAYSQIKPRKVRDLTMDELSALAPYREQISAAFDEIQVEAGDAPDIEA